MFDNIGGKIKMVAKVECWLGIIASVISGIVLMGQGENAAAVGFLVIVFGSLFSWIGSFVTYGFGQLVENSDILATQNKDNNTRNTQLSEEVKRINTSDSFGEKTQEQTPFAATENQTKICLQCNYEQAANRKVCWQCGAKFPQEPFVCGKCGRAGDYTGNCPDCGSTIKKYNYDTQ